MRGPKPVERCQGRSQTGMPGGKPSRGKDGFRRSLRVFPLDGTLPRSDGSPWTAQQRHLKNGETGLQVRWARIQAQGRPTGSRSGLRLAATGRSSPMPTPGDWRLPSAICASSATIVPITAHVIALAIAAPTPFWTGRVEASAGGDALSGAQGGRELVYPWPSGPRAAHDRAGARRAPPSLRSRY